MSIERSAPDKAGAEVVQLGKALYDRMRPELEATADGQYVAIHVDSGDFRVADSTAKATRALLEQHPIDGRIFIRKIGDEPEYGLAARLLAGEAAGDHRR
jgi:hypothetical protein